MFKFIKNKFLFILLLSIITLAVLVIGALSLYKDNSSIFASDGYIIETSTKTNTKYYFSANTKYKENVEEKITFEDKDKNKVSVDPASFVHYDNGNISFLQKGALVNLSDITAPMVSYYNITAENTITYEQNHYTVTSNDKKINIDSFIGRINDSKYIIAGENLSLKIPTENDRILGDYFEVYYLEEGIVKIDNKDHSYQVTAQDSYLYIGDNITISLGDGKIFYDGDAKMLMSQITINNDENIDLDVEEDKGGGSGDGSGEDENDGEGTGTGEGTDEDKETGEGTGTGEGEDAEDGEGAGEDTGKDGEGTDGTGTGEGTNTTENVQIELIEAKVTSTAIDLRMQLNNANLAKGKIKAHLTNAETGDKEPEKNIELKNGEFQLQYSKLATDTTYVLTIVDESKNQYFQKSFKTNELGLTLEKTYATDTSLAYKLIFDQNTEVTEAHVTISGGENDNINPNEYTIKASDKDKSFTFGDVGDGDKGKLEPNTSYSITVDEVTINNAADPRYSFGRTDTTLKTKPKVWGVNVEPDAEEVEFTIKLENIDDPNTSIISYTYNIYLASDINNPERVAQCEPIVKKDAEPLVLNLNERGLKTGVDYRAEIIVQYNNNEMIRELDPIQSSSFLIKSKAKIDFVQTVSTINSIKGVITLIDPNCTVPMQGRMCVPQGAPEGTPQTNNITLRYYESSPDESEVKEIEFKPGTLTYDLSLGDLKSNTKYVAKIIGTYYNDKGGKIENDLIGEFTFETKKSEKIYFEPQGNNTSSGNSVVTFDAKFSEPLNPEDMDIATVTFNLYSGRNHNDKSKLIGSYTVTGESAIEQLFSNFRITNGLFIDTTENNLGKLDTVEKLITVTNNSTGTLNGSYTVEVEDAYDSTGKNKITIENNTYIFNLTPSYYLDTRINTNPDETYVTVTPILKENLTEEEYDELEKKVENLDKLNPQTIVGLTIENSLSDIFVNSAYKTAEGYKYEKATVNYTICNNTMRHCDDIIGILTDNNLDNDDEEKNKITLKSDNMGNNYQPKTQTFYLNTSDYPNFTRGYNYKVGFYITFSDEEGEIEHYTNEKLYNTLPIERQAPMYTQYISNSSSNGITYRYSFSDVDDALGDKNFYYTLGENKTDYNKVENSLIADGKYNDVTLPIKENSTYTLYYSRKNTQNATDYVEITTNDFETEYNYNDEYAYEILEPNDNVLKIKLADNDVINRAYVYKVVINSTDDTTISPYTRYFLASKLSTITEDTGTTDEEGNPITKNYKYIAIDYGNISKFMGHNLKVTISSYFDSGLVGYNQNFTNGFILKNRLTNKYLNIYNSGSNVTGTAEENDINMGLYLLREPFEKDGETIFIYNHLQDTKDYNPLIGATYYNTKDLAESIGVKFNTNPINEGMSLAVGKKDYKGYDAKVLKEATLTSAKDTYKFDAIVPTIVVTREQDKTNKNTINSVAIEMTAKGIYGGNQFTKDGKTHNKVYVELYSDAECTKPVLERPKDTDINITENGNNGYNATIDAVKFENLNPATTYYVKIFAYVNDKYTQLYDDASTASSYITKTYETKTLDNVGIMGAINFNVKPIVYNGESSKKQLNWNVTLKSTANYKLRFELYKPNGTSTETNPETGEEITITNFVPVKFDGTDANSCNIDKTGNSSNGYIYKDKDGTDNCYISVDKDDITKLDIKNGQKYTFTGDNFVFGGKYYKLVVYAIPYTNNSYAEDQKLLLYQNDSLTSTTKFNEVYHVAQDIAIPELSPATFSLKDSLSAGFESEEEGYYVKFTPTIYDDHNVIKNGKYTITLTDKESKVIGSEDDKKCTYYINQDNDPKVKTVDECIITMDANSGNQIIKFTGLNSNTQYNIELSYEAYRNNYGFTEIEKRKTATFTDIIYTPISNNVTLGGMRADEKGSTGVIISYNGSNNLSEKIVRVDYTIKQTPGSEKVTGTYKIDSNNSSIFTISTDRMPKLTINTNDDSHSADTSFTLKKGSAYLIETQYYYDTNGNNIYDEDIDKLLEDQSTGETTFTTFLNLD